jgi:hypothetical protein
LFELRALFELQQRSLPQPQLHHVLLQQAAYADEWITATITIVRETIQTIRHLNLYNEYVTAGWTKNIHQHMHTIVVPTMISLVATIWYLALTNSTVTRHDPLIGR